MYVLNEALSHPGSAPRSTETRVALVYPPTAAVTVMPPLGIGYLSSVISKAGYAVDVFDLGRRHLPPRAFQQLLRERRYDIIGLSISTPNLSTAAATAKLIHEAVSGSEFVIGGPHVSAYPGESLHAFGADYGLVGESEGSFVRFLDARARGDDPAGDVPGVIRLEDGRLVGAMSFDRPDVQMLPWPDWERIEPHRYPPIPHQMFVKAFPVAPVMTTRGCPYNCSFCASTRLFGPKIRRRQVDDVVAEMTFLRDRFGVREIHFEDDNLTLNRRHAVRLFEKIIETHLGVHLKCPNGVMTSALDPPLMGLMKRAGMYQISLGIETTSPDLLESERKYLELQRVRETVRQAREAGLEVQGLYIAGLPGDDEEGFRRSVREAMEMKLDLAHFGLFMPLAGSQSGDALDATQLRAANFFTPHPVHGEAWRRKWKALQRWAILRFYLRPRQVALLVRRTQARQVFGVLQVFRKYLFAGAAT